MHNPLRWLSPRSTLLLFLFLFCWLFTGPAQGASPWLWNKVLKQDLTQDAMIRPRALFIDTVRELYYVVDTGNNRLLSFSRSGELLSIFNAGKSLSLPSDMVKNEKGGIWIVEMGINSLSYIDLNEKKVQPNTLKYKGELVYPEKVEIDSGLLYVLNKARGNIIAYSHDLKAQSQFSSSECPMGFVDFKIHKGKLWALDQAGKTIRCFTLNGKLIKTFSLAKSLNFPVSLAIGPNGYLYVLDRQQRNISVYDREGLFKYRFLERGIARGQLSHPIEIRFDPWGGLCLVDEGNARVEIYRR